MYYCMKCDSKFEEFKKVHTTYEEYYEIASDVMSRTPMTLYFCPCCGADSDYIEELSECDMCEGYYPECVLTDTEGFPNGGVGQVCPDCLKNME